MTTLAALGFAFLLGLKLRCVLTPFLEVESDFLGPCKEESFTAPVNGSTTCSTPDSAAFRSASSSTLSSVDEKTNLETKERLLITDDDDLVSPRKLLCE